MSQIPDPAPLRAALLTWYARAHRDLPWRHTDDPYAVWVSEVMLQQTQVSTVIPYYRRFMERFPSVGELARASLDDVLAVWQGLGYYGRARNLHRAAALVCEQYHGRLPCDPVALRALPGIGDYTAGAILSIAYGQPVPALDANAVRVLARLLDLDDLPTRARARRQLAAMAQALLPLEDPGRLNQALMELGALICLPADPGCQECPWNDACLAFAHGTVAQRPVRPARRQVPTKRFVGVGLIEGSSVLLCRRRPRGLLGGLWEIPNVELASEADAIGAVRSLLVEFGLRDVSLEDPALSISHAYSHFGLQLQLYRGKASGDPGVIVPWDRCAWLSLDQLDRLGLTGVTIKALAALSVLQAPTG